MKSFISGFGFSLRGFQLVRENRDLKKWIILPLLINALVFFFGFIGSFSVVGRGVDYLMGTLTSWMSFLSPEGVIVLSLTFIFQILFWIISLAFLVYFSFILGSILASPFNSILAEKVLAKKGVFQNNNKGMVAFIIFSIKMFLISMVKAFIFVGIGLLLFILSFIPGVNFFTSYLTFLIMAFDCYDYSYEVLGYSLTQRFSRFRRSILASNGMACNLALTMILPGATLLVLPFAIVGAADLLCQENSLSSKR